MGTGYYKGNTAHYHSIGQNVMVTTKSYPMQNGYFGVNSPSTGNRTRNIISADNLATAEDFYSKIANGGLEKEYKHGALRITRMHDGTVITMRTVSHSDGTPVVEINISSSRSTGGVKQQKIHFVKGDEKK